MALMGRLHPLLVHFPIALILIAAVAELVAMATRMPEWRAVAVANVRAGAAFAIVAAVAGWLLGSSRLVEPSAGVEWHPWVGLSPAMGAIAAALTTGNGAHPPRPRQLWGDRGALFFAAGLVGVAGQ